MIQMHFRSHRAFTLIELLVVITIIVVLLALLTPALDKAIYQAELAVCMTDLKTVANGATIYAAEHKRRWLWRRQVTNNDNIKPNNVSKPNEDSVFSGHDDMQRFMRYFDFDNAFNCPLSTDVSWEDSSPESGLEVDYYIWFGWEWVHDGSHKGMFKMGDRFTYTDAALGRTYKWNLLAGDYDFSSDAPSSHHTHQDKDGVSVEEVLQDEPGFLGLDYTLSRWVADGVRGPVDTQMVRDDGSVERYTDETWEESGVNPALEESRFVAAPITDSGETWPGQWINMPKR